MHCDNYRNKKIATMTSHARSALTTSNCKHVCFHILVQNILSETQQAEDSSKTFIPPMMSREPNLLSKVQEVVQMNHPTKSTKF